MTNARKRTIRTVIQGAVGFALALPAIVDASGIPAAAAIALAELRGTMETGFATVNGSLALLAQRHDQTDRASTTTSSASKPWSGHGGLYPPSPRWSA